MYDCTYYILLCLSVPINVGLVEGIGTAITPIIFLFLSLGDCLPFMSFSASLKVSSLSLGRMEVFVYPLFAVVIERVEVHFCPDVSNDDYRNVSALLSKMAMKVP